MLYTFTLYTAISLLEIYPEGNTGKNRKAVFHCNTTKTGNNPNVQQETGKINRTSTHCSTVAALQKEWGNLSFSLSL